MICKNCGAEFQDNARNCPFCGADNFEQSLKEHQDTLNDSNRKAHFWNSLPERLARKGQRAIVLGLIIFLAVAAIVAVVGVSVSKVNAKREYEKQMQAVEELETLYQDKDYEGVARRYRELELGYQSKFEKYQETTILDGYYHSAKDTMEQDIQNAKLQQADIYLYNQLNWFDLLEQCTVYEKEGYLYDEEEMVSFYREKAMTALQEQLHLPGPAIALILEECQQIQDYDEKEEYRESLQKLLYDSIMKEGE
ncbi:MAG: hypothetical protein PUB19_07285 [Lachnospiraceae bacterium]|nr:hypothetical protein [Lachnospiraceae bacterium]